LLALSCHVLPTAVLLGRCLACREAHVTMGWVMAGAGSGAWRRRAVGGAGAGEHALIAGRHGFEGC
jgi:hypothetical protein